MNKVVTGMQTKQNRRRLWYFLSIAVGVHLVLILAIAVRTWHEEPEPSLSGAFVKRRPLRQQVLERRVTSPSPVRIVRRSVSAPRPFARAVAQRSMAPPAPQLLASREFAPQLPTRPVNLARGIPGSGRIRSTAAEIAVQSKDNLDLGLELLDIEAMDTGRYRAMVVVDPDDRRNLQGFVHFSAVAIPSTVESVGSGTWGTILPRALARWADMGLPGTGDWRHSANIRALQGLASELEAETNLKAVVDEDLTLLSPEVMESPFILLTSTAEFKPSKEEAVALGKYLASGGFAYVEQVGRGGFESWQTGEILDLISLRDLIRQALSSQGYSEGVDWDFEPLRRDHPIFHCYYDIDTLPVSFWEAVYIDVLGEYEKYSRGRGGGIAPPLRKIPVLEGVYIDGRLVATYSHMNCRDFWYRRAERALTDAKAYVLGTPGGPANYYAGVPWHKPTSDPAIRVGINAVIYALTQEGSLARRYVKVR